MMTVPRSHLRLMEICTAQGPDWETSRADARAAVCLEHGTSPDDITSLGYPATPEAYDSVRRSWVSLIEQFGFNELFDGPRLAEARGWWKDARPDLVADDWLAAGRAAHLERHPEQCESALRGGCTLHEQPDI